MFESGNEAKISPEALAHWPKSEIECNHLRERERESWWHTITVKDRENSIRLFELQANPAGDGSPSPSLSRFQSNSTRELPSPEGSATINVLSSICNFVSTTSTPIKRRRNGG